MMPLKQVNEGMEAWVINRCVLFVFHRRKQGDWTTAQIDTCDATKYPENKMKHGEYRAKKNMTNNKNVGSKGLRERK